jgi:uncharacterized membrane protein YjgN (DUF898 family)
MQDSSQELPNGTLPAANPVHSPFEQPTFGRGTPLAAITEYRLKFVGSGGEYFRIWIVNLLLSILTLGIYSAWAKVRREQYFHRNTILDGSGFDYHGDPRAILNGRLIAVGLLAILSLVEKFAPVYYPVALLLLAPLVPWLLIRSFVFRSRNTSFRGLHFNFRGTYKGLCKAFMGCALAFATLIVMVGYSDTQLEQIEQATAEQSACDFEDDEYEDSDDGEYNDGDDEVNADTSPLASMEELSRLRGSDAGELASLEELFHLLETNAGELAVMEELSRLLGTDAGEPAAIDDSSPLLSNDDDEHGGNGEVNADCSAEEECESDSQATVDAEATLLLFALRLGFLGMLLLLPAIIGHLKRFQINHLSFGASGFHAQLRLQSFYGIYLRTLLPYLAIAVAVIVLLASIMSSDESSVADWLFVFAVSLLAIYVASLVVQAYLSALTANLIWNNTNLHEHRFVSDQTFWGITSITLSNWLLIFLTAGFFWPWAKVRLAAYRAGRTAMLVAGDLEHFVAGAIAEKNAIGEEIAEAFDFDIGL